PRSTHTLPLRDALPIYRRADAGNHNNRTAEEPDMKRLISSCVLALSGTAFFSTGVMAAEPASCKNVRMGVVNWTDVIATSAMTQDRKSTRLNSSHAQNS